MNIVNAGSRFQIFGDEVKTYKTLPAMSFDVGYAQFTGFFLTSRNDLAVNEAKVYGDHQRRVNKVMNGFEAASRNFGVILSGQKGIGKSLFARMLAEAAIARGMPVITVSEAIPGISDFLASIHQEVLIIFDEFEKNFMAHKHDDWNPQVELLSLFDGLDNGKKLFCITCNDPKDLNDYLVNRPGRFHYHFTVHSPTDVEIREYLSDKLLPQYSDQIEKVVMFGQTIAMTYDYLRAIVFELNQGYSFEESLADLNISRNNDVCFDIGVILTNGAEFTGYDVRMDLYSDRTVETALRSPSNYAMKYGIYIEFCPKDIKVENNELTLDPSKVSIEWPWEKYEDLSDEDTTKAKAEDAKIGIKKIVFVKRDISFVQKYMV